jgi:hypothetical protein
VSQIFINGREFLIIHSSERTPWHLFSELRAAEIDAGTLVANATKAVNRPPPHKIGIGRDGTLIQAHTLP